MAAVELRYDLRNRPLEESRWHFTAQGPVGDGYARTTYLYDEQARTVTITDDLGRSTQVRADGVGRTVQIRLPDNSLVTTAFLDGGRTVRTTRNGVGGQVVELHALTATGAVSEASTEIAGVRRVMSSTTWLDPFLPGTTYGVAGAATKPTYDAFERVTGSTVGMPDGTGETVSVLLDRDGRVLTRSSVATTNGPSSSWQFAYDALGRVVRATDPAGAATDTEYVGTTDRVWTSVDARRVRTTNTWADAGWLAQSFVDAPTGDDVTLTFIHDSLGRMMTAVRRDGATAAVANSFAWDSLGNAVSETDNQVSGSARTHRYDGAGQRVASTIGAHSISRTFDPLGRQTSLKVGAESPSTATWSYGAPGGPTQRLLRNGVSSVYGYDALSRLTTVADWKGSTRLAAYDWELPLDGVPRRLWSQQRNFAVQNRVYAIDSAGRLNAEQLGTNASFQLAATDVPAAATTTALNTMTSAATRYTLDGRNNWLTRSIGSASTSYARDARDGLTAIGTQAVTSDALGAITGDGSTTYRYDALGLLSEVRPNSGGGRIYKRDALGRIVSETDIASGATTRFAWDGAQRAFVQRPDGSLETTLAAESLDAPVVTLFPNGARRYFHQDRQGSVYAQTDDAGLGQLWLTYSAYGEPSLLNASGRTLPATGVLPNFGYHGLPHDFGLGLVDMRARTYRPTLGRFLSPDPIGLLGDANLFAFANSGPLTWRDPFGLTTKAEEAAAANRAAADHLRTLAVMRGYDIGGLDFRSLASGVAPVSPSVAPGTTSTGITGTQGPTR
jgi:RHS repeat-associated protein